jgi:hypothetical protein
MNTSECAKSKTSGGGINKYGKVYVHKEKIKSWNAC